MGAKQEDLAGDKITRNLISYIENGKTRLTRSTAEVIAENMIRLSEAQKNPIHISVDYLMETEMEQANRILEKLRNELEKYSETNEKRFIEVFQRAEEILAEWNLPERRAAIYEVVGDFYYQKQKYHESYIHYIKALEDYIRINHHRKTAWIYSLLGRVSIKLKNYQETINFNNYSMLILESHHMEAPEIMKRILFNNALAYWYLQLHDHCLEFLDKLTKTYDDFSREQYMDILLIKGNYFLDRNELNQAEKIYSDILKIAQENNYLEMMAITYYNFCEIYKKRGQEPKAIEYGLKALEIREKIDSKLLGDTLLVLGESYQFIGNYSQAEEYLLKALAAVRRRFDRRIQAEAYKLLFKNYIYTQNYKAIDNLINELYENVEIGVSAEVLGIYMEASRYYLSHDVEKAAKFLERGLEKLNTSC
ncbi:tetratricopeptide repeat protein [Thermotalea metallivorans]|uniref:Uncharacterized protein n=1 Tax=Thermotalea metallivorans TaxID=520762 RepID=A0A140KZ86_9FIRM|nr:tetratricopeptide repeat protein [Thermotalea metallivorans]KXG73611.1 hypothetical protein AN619_30570 [Thermotalea metallivorans]